jgi:hypothetical protein
MAVANLSVLYLGISKQEKKFFLRDLFFPDSRLDCGKYFFRKDYNF